MIVSVHATGPHDTMHWWHQTKGAFVLSILLGNASSYKRHLSWLNMPTGWLQAAGYNNKPKKWHQLVNS